MPAGQPAGIFFNAMPYGCNRENLLLLLLMPDLQDLNDNELIELLKDDYERALAALYRRYYTRLFAVAINRLDHQEEAEECVQDVFLGLYKQRASFTLRAENLSYYLMKAVMNGTFRIMARKHRQRMQLAGYHPDVHTDVSPEQQLMVKELKQRIEQAVNELPSQCRLVFRLNREQGLTAAQIAQELDISENTVNSHLKKARKDLRSKLDSGLPLLSHTALLYIQQYLG